MDLNQIFEFPLPEICVEAEKIHINLTEENSGQLHIKNVGFGNLNGVIVSKTDCIFFENYEFEGNNIFIKYEIKPYAYFMGEFIKSEITIISNGGEISIPVFIQNPSTNYLVCKEEKIKTIRDFYKYFKKNNKDAIRVFNSYEFILWLKKMDFSHIDITEVILEDKNRQRAIDNFFILTGIKEKAKFMIVEDFYRYRYFNKNEDEIIGIVSLKIIGEGYLESDIFLENNYDWISLDKYKITNKDFDTDGNCFLHFKINKNKIKRNFEREKILFSGIEKAVTVELQIKPPIEIIFERQFFETADTGSISIINNTGKDILIKVLPKDNFVKFEGEKYLIGKHTELKFDIKIAGFLKAQIDFTRRPYIESEILFKAQFDDKIFKDNRKIYIGNSFI